jgi:hypothetical protein
VAPLLVVQLGQVWLAARAERGLPSPGTCKYDRLQTVTLEKQPSCKHVYRKKLKLKNYPLVVHIWAIECMSE